MGFCRNFGVNVQEDGIEFTRKLEPGVVRLEKYGIELAKTCGFPAEVKPLKVDGIPDV
jgi:DNA mismatch repair ATPase MutS